MVHPVDEVADIVQIGGHLDQFNFVLGIAQRLQDIFGVLRHIGDMGEAVLCEAEGCQRVVRLGDIGPDFFVLLEIFDCQYGNPTFLVWFFLF